MHYRMTLWLLQHLYNYLLFFDADHKKPSIFATFLSPPFLFQYTLRIGGLLHSKEGENDA